MYDPTETELSNAMAVLRQELASAMPSTVFGEDDIRTWTRKVLSICYSIGGDYRPEFVRDVANAYIRKHAKP